MLPFMEQTPLYNSCNFSWGLAGKLGYWSNLTQQVTKLAAYMCPSDGIVGQQGSNNSYVGSIGVTTDWYCGGNAACNNSNNPALALAPSTGIFARTQTYGIQHVTDGTSNTIAFSEMLAPDDSAPSGFATGNPNVQPQKSSRWRDAVQQPSGSQGAMYYQLNATTNVPALTADINLCNADYTAGKNLGGTGIYGRMWAAGDLGSSAFNTIITPSNPQSLWADCRLDAHQYNNEFDSGYHQAASNHPGGVNVSFADGSVRFVKSSIAQRIWWALGTRNLGEVISSDSY